MMSDKSAKKYTHYSLYNLFFMSDMLLISLVLCVVLLGVFRCFFFVFVSCLV